MPNQFDIRDENGRRLYITALDVSEDGQRLIVTVNTEYPDVGPPSS